MANDSDSDSSGFDVDKLYPLFDYIPLNLKSTRTQKSVILKPFLQFPVSKCSKNEAIILMDVILDTISSFFKIDARKVNWMNPLPGGILEGTGLTSENDYLIYKDLIYLLWRSKLIPLLLVFDEDSKEDILGFLDEDRTRLPVVLIEEEKVKIEGVFENFLQVKNWGDILKEVEVSLQGKDSVGLMEVCKVDDKFLKALTPHVFFNLLTYSSIGNKIRSPKIYKPRKIRMAFLDKTVLDNQNHIFVTDDSSHANLTEIGTTNVVSSYFGVEETLKTLKKDSRPKHFLRSISNDLYELVYSTTSIEDFRKNIADDLQSVKNEKVLYNSDKQLKVLCGAKGSGKTVFLRHLQGKLSSNHYALYIDLQKNLKLMNGLTYEESNFTSFLAKNALQDPKDTQMLTFLKQLFQNMLQTKTLHLLLDDFTPNFTKLQDLLNFATKTHLNLFITTTKEFEGFFPTLSMHLEEPQQKTKSYPIFNHIPLKLHKYQKKLNFCQSKLLLETLNHFNITKVSPKNGSVITTAIFNAISQFFNFKIEGLSWDLEVPKTILDVINIFKKDQFFDLQLDTEDLLYKDLIYMLWKIREVPLIVHYDRENRGEIDKFIGEQLEDLSIVLITDLDVELGKSWRIFEDFSGIADEDLVARNLDMLQVSLQGKTPLTLSTLLQNNRKVLETITPDVYVMLMTKYMTIGHTDYLPYYVPRKFTSPLLKPSVLTEPGRLFIIIQDPNLMDIQDFVKNPQGTLMGSKLNPEETLSILRGFKVPKHVLEVTESGLYKMVASEGSVVQLLRHSVQDCVYEEDFYSEVFPRLRIFHGGTGTGKTTFLRQTQRRSPPNVFTVFVDDQNSLDLSQGLLEGLVGLQVPDVEVKGFFLEVCRLLVEAEAFILLVDCCEVPNLVELALESKIRTLVATRKGCTQNELSMLAHQLVPFDDSDQILFLENFYQCTVEDEGRRDDLLTKIVTNRSEIMCEMFGTPLVLRVLSDIFEFISEFDRDTMSTFFVDNDEINDKSEVIRWMLSNKDYLDISEAIVNCEEPDILVKILSIFKVDLKATDVRGRTILHGAIKNGNISALEVLLDQKIDLTHDLVTGTTIFHEMALTGNVKIANILKQKFQAHVDVENFSMETPIFEAVRSGVLNMVQWHLKLKSDVNKTNLEGDTPLHVALQKPNEDIIKLLIENGANLKTQNKKGETPLYLAILHGHDNLANLLISKGAEVNVQEHQYGLSPAHLIAQTQNQETAKLLIQSGANPHLQDLEGRTPYNIALKNSPEILAIFNQSTPKLQLHEAIKTASFDQIVDLIETLNLDTNEIDENGVSPLFLAIDRNRSDVAQYLLGKGAKLTPILIVKAVKTSVEICSGLNIDVKFEYQGKPLLFWATLHNKPDVVQWLLDKGAKPNDDILRLSVILGNPSVAQKFRHSNSAPISLAVHQGNLEMVKLLIGSTPEPTLMHQAAASGNISVCQFLKDSGFSLECTDVTGWTPIFYAVDYNKVETLDWLLKNGAEPMVRDQRNLKTPLHRASEHGHMEIVEKLLEHQNVDINCFDKNNCTPLMLAVSNNRVDIVKILLEKGADWNIEINSFGGKLFHWTAKIGDLEIAEELYKNNKNVNEEENDGSSPLFYAKEYGREEMADWLCNHYLKA